LVFRDGDVVVPGLPVQTLDQGALRELEKEKNTS